jgi:hypothetical protein
VSSISSQKGKGLRRVKVKKKGPLKVNRLIDLLHGGSARWLERWHVVLLGGRGGLFRQVVGVDCKQTGVR